MKKLLKIVLAGLMVLSLSACSKSEEPKVDAQENAYDLIVIGSGAAGLSLKLENLDKFREKMCELVRESGVLNEVPSVTIDYKADIDDFYDETVEKLMSLAPFGMGFERPNIAYRGKIKNLSLLPRKEVEKKHVSFDLTGDEISIKCCWWNCIDKWTNYTSRASNNEVYVLGTPKVEIFKGEEQFKLTINDLKAAK